MRDLRKIKNRLYNLTFSDKEQTATIKLDEQRVLEASTFNNKPDSVLFYTTHKCASSFINQLLSKLSEYSEYKTIDYANAIWALGNNLEIGQEKKDFLIRFLENNYDRLFYNKGEIYAPLRFPVDFPNRASFKHVFFLRDPRDVLVSSYYSFGITHSLPSNNKAKKRVIESREKILRMGLDQYVIDFSDELIDRYNSYKELKETCNSFVYLKYDDYLNDTKFFIKKLSDFLDTKPSDKEIELLCKEASPIQSKIQEHNHKRSGKSAQFINELNPDTITIINNKFQDILLYWDFKNYHNI